MASDKTKTGMVLRHHEYGKPSEVLECAECEVPEPGAGEVLIRLRRAVINPSDLGMIQGSYGRLRELPAVAGREGIGEVVALGSGVEEPGVGAWVRFPEDPGVWREYTVAKAAALLEVPNDLPLDQAAMAFVNPPTALRLIDDFESLEPGDWIIQNAANSAVGLSVIALAKARGLRTLNVVRRPELVDPLLQRGADAVVLEEDAYEKDPSRWVGEGAIRLGLNSVGGESVIKIIRAMSDGGTVVTFGGMVGTPVRFPTRNLIFNDIELRGFWFDRWKREVSPAGLLSFYQEVFQLIREGVFDLPVEAVYPLPSFREALEHQARPRLGKVLLSMDPEESSD